MTKQQRPQRTGRGQAGSSGIRQKSQWPKRLIAMLALFAPWPHSAQVSAPSPFSTTPRSLHNIS